MFDCPVCPRKNITDETCPQCGTDLGPLIRVTDLPQLYYRDALALLDEGKVKEGIERLNAAISFRPGFTDAYFRLSEAYVKKGWYEEAIGQLDQALELEPQREEIRQLRDSAEQRLRQSRIEQESQQTSAARLRKLVLVFPAMALAIGLVTMPLIQFIGGQSSQQANGVSSLVAQLQQEICNRQVLKDSPLEITLVQDKPSISGEVATAAHLELVREIAARLGGARVEMAGLKVRPVEAPPAVIVTYKVQAGDSLWTIAKRKYGDARLWTAILARNKDRLSQTGRLSIGDEIRLYPVTISPR